ncbi:MAG: efflux RND transporter periplasmic adaptor subunit [Desulfomonile tiedjei]|uniref:Efflux RND transporter periplasmic adaptor subunit n=1 Tax=Desulfomonile tiedjei TaxID=2358 RepID=A0A9D6UZJ1_9BACT|nr:efflux RND transporter periplasmic adaptor subunit [Desulfomonile tiedjei]
MAENIEQTIDQRRSALATALELAKNATRARTLDELQFVLVNDTRSLLPFDRSLLILHFRGKSSLAAANNVTRLDSRGEVFRRVTELAPKLRDIRTGLILFPDTVPEKDVPPEAARELKDYMNQSGCFSLMVIPFATYDSVIGHLILEFFDKVPPGQVETYTFMNMVPFFSSALAQKWLLANDSRARKSFLAALSSESASDDRRKRRFRAKIIAAAFIFALAALCYPFTLTVGGKAEVVPEHEYIAFVEIEGIVQTVFAREGESVKKDQKLAELEAKEIDYKIRESRRSLKAYEAEMEILRSMGAENPLKLAESRLVAIKGLRARQDLEFLDWQREFLNIKSPIDGIVLTKKVETLVGKRFKAGEPFCRVAPYANLEADVFIRESDIGYIEKNQTGDVYFNYRPDQAYKLRVKTISPKSESMERLGAVFRVRAELSERPSEIKPGMLGIAHIDTKRESLWFILTRRIRIKLNELSLSL